MGGAKLLWAELADARQCAVFYDITKTMNLKWRVTVRFETTY